MARYKEYKNCCIEWIGEIPSHWDTAPLWSLSSCNDDVLGDDTRGDYAFEYYDVSSVEEGVIGKGQHYTFLDAPSRARRLVRPSDVVISTVRTYLRAIARVDMEQAGSVFSTGFAVLRPTAIDPAYFFYCLSSEGFIEEVVKHSDGVSYPAIPPNSLLKIRLPKPPLDEQKAIANYLESRTAEINRLISETEKTIELLEEYRKSMISEIVTRGLNPDVPMKDSGIEWIGKIPEHWEIKKFKYVASVAANLVNPSDYPDYQQVSPERMEKGTGKLFKCDTVLNSGVESDNHFFKTGSILYSKVRPTLNKVALASFDGLCSADIYPIVTNDCSKWLIYAMLSQPFVFQVRVSADRVKMPKINKEELGTFLIPVPPIDEQEAIASKLDIIALRLGRIIKKKNNFVSRLHAYRKSLISEAITGKFKVSGAE